MPKVTLLTRIYNSTQLKIIEAQLRNIIKGLKVEIENVETEDNWVKITFSGEDERIFLNYLERNVGLCPIDIRNVKKSIPVKGYITNLDKSNDEITVDIGIHNPKTIFAILPLQRLQAQLADGRKLAIKKIIELYGFCENLPITIKVTALEGNYIEAMLSETQLRLYREWVKSLLDRLIVIGSTKNEVERVLKRANCQNDIIGIDPLGPFENCIICKLGTNATGIIPKIGKHLPETWLSIFSPRRLIEFFGDMYTIPTCVLENLISTNSRSGRMQLKN
ncbi:MAG: DUF2110 family protein [Candidatus Bathyarchaeia archaeon]